jgi:hypothetical protein
MLTDNILMIKKKIEYTEEPYRSDGGFIKLKRKRKQDATEITLKKKKKLKGK